MAETGNSQCAIQKDDKKFLWNKLEDILGLTDLGFNLQAQRQDVLHTLQIPLTASPSQAAFTLNR